MSAPKILAQSVCPHICLGGVWIRPVLVRLKFTVDGSSNPTVNTAKTAPGITVAKSATGRWTVSAPSCRQIDVESVSLAAATPTTLTNARVVDADEASASAGTCVLRCRNYETDSGAQAAEADPENGSTITAWLWLDLG